MQRTFSTITLLKSMALAGSVVVPGLALASEGPLQPEYTEVAHGNRMEQCARFQSSEDSLHVSTFCRIRYSKLVDLEVVHEYECSVSGFKTAGYPGWGNDLVSFDLEVDGKSLQVKARSHSSGYGGPYWYTAKVPCDGKAPLKVSYVFEAPSIYGRQDNHGQGFQLELGEFSR